MGTWEHMKVGISMMLSDGIAGMTFSGADVGGFFGNPSPEMLTRWYQIGAFSPFFRAHAHIDTKRREPWLPGEPYTSQIRQAVRNRYAFLPYIYTVFYEASTTGLPVMRPLWLEFPRERTCFGIEDQWMLGSSLLIKAVTRPNQRSTSIYFPPNSVWFDIHTSLRYTSSIDNYATPAERIPVFQRAGSIISKRERIRRSSALMVNDPYTLVIALDGQGHASGTLYIDDGYSNAYLSGVSLVRFFNLTCSSSSCQFSSSSLFPSSSYKPTSTIERILILGLSPSVSSIIAVSSSGSSVLTFVQSLNPDLLIIRKPDLAVTDNFTITIKF